MSAARLKTWFAEPGRHSTSRRFGLRSVAWPTRPPTVQKLSPPTAGVAHPGELLFEDYRKRHHKFLGRELRDHGTSGVEAQFSAGGVLSRSADQALDHRSPRSTAIQSAERKRKASARPTVQPDPKSPHQTLTTILGLERPRPGYVDLGAGCVYVERPTMSFFWTDQDRT